MINLFKKSINQDIYNLLYSLHVTYNIDLYLLLNTYIPNIQFKKTIKKQIIKKTNKQCTARCWGGKQFVKYNPLTKKWTYGYRCKRYSIINSQYCLTHHKLSLKSTHLPHGTYNSSVPHIHYLKYQKKIESQFNIKY